MIFDAKAALMTVIIGHRIIGRDEKHRVICECKELFLGLLAQDERERKQQEIAIAAIHTNAVIGERNRCLNKLRKVADQCEAGGHTSRARCFRAIADELAVPET